MEMRQNDSYQTQLSVHQTTRKSKTGRISKTTDTTKVTQPAYRKKKPIGKMVVFGAMSLGFYALLLSNMQLVTNTFTLGGWYAVLPVGTAFLFSFVHGAFASNFLSVLGLEPKKS
jgi:uncharacterized integral membrane protein